MVEPLFRTAFATPPAVGLAVTLGGSEGKHAVNVRRMRVGEGIQLSDGKGLRVRGERRCKNSVSIESGRNLK